MRDAGLRKRILGPRRARALSVVALTLLALLLTTSGAFAGRTWCRTDPVVTINDSVADVFVGGPLTAPLQVTGPTQVVVTVPMGVNAGLLLSDLGFGRG